VDQLGREWLARAHIMSAMLREFLSTPESFLRAEQEDADLRELIEGIVRRGQERGEFRTRISPRLAAAVFLSTSLAILSGGVFREGEASPEEIREQFLEVVLNGLVARPPTHRRAG
jgi:hypothetical protein